MANRLITSWYSTLDNLIIPKLNFIKEFGKPPKINKRVEEYGILFASWLKLSDTLSSAIKFPTLPTFA